MQMMQPGGMPAPSPLAEAAPRPMMPSPVSVGPAMPNPIRPMGQPIGSGLGQMAAPQPILEHAPPAPMIR